jgi:hypothetical protein
MLRQPIQKSSSRRMPGSLYYTAQEQTPYFGGGNESVEYAENRKK